MAENRGRRYDERVSVHKNSGWKVIFEHGNRTFSLDIIDVSKDGLRIKTSQKLAEGAIESMKGKISADLAKNGTIRYPIQFSIIRSFHLDDGSDLTLQCLLCDDASRAQIWHLIYESKNPTPLDQETAASGSHEKSRIPGRGIYTEQARLLRLEFIQEKTGVSCDFVRDSHLSAHRLAGNIENHIGGVEVPVGLAGPLLFNGRNAQGEIYAPFATSEGALVASASRGALLLSESGGVTTRTIAQRMIRVPLFVMNSLDSALFFSDWLKSHVPELQAAVAKVSHHAMLSSVDITLSGRVVHASFVFSTGDAAGQNMTTAATWHACQWALSQARHFRGVSVENFFIDSGLSGDKKVNYKSFLEGRGTRVIAEAFIPGETLQRIMKITPDQLVAYFNSGMAALIQAGAIGSNINVANTIAGMFVATGQDIACVHESSLAIFHIEKTDHGVYTSMHLPALIIGTVGGGSSLPAQAECLKIMGCYGQNKVARLAEIIAGYCLALDLSTISALVGGTFVKAHERLGRNRPVKWFKQNDLDMKFFASVLGAHMEDITLMVHEVAASAAIDTTDSIITELTARNQEKLLGLIPFRVSYTHQAQTHHNVEIVVKSKPIDQEVILLANKMAGMCNSTLGDLYERFKLRSESFKCHLKELAILGQKDERFTRNVPKIYGIYQDEKREVFLAVMERLQNMMLMGNVDNPAAWKKEYVEAAIHGMAELHSIWYGRDKELKDQPWIGYVQTSTAIKEQKPLFKEMAIHGGAEFPELITKEILMCCLELIDTVDVWWTEFDAMPKTLIHNDFNPRNIALRQVEGKPHLCAFDWELATIHVPQRDLAELLSFVTTGDTTPEQIDGYIELHRRRLEEFSQSAIPQDTWRRGYELSLYDFAISRLAMYVMAHTFKQYSFMEHLLTNNSRLITLARLGSVKK